VGSVAAVAVTLVLALVWLPSSVSTVLKFRSGAIGSLRDKEFYIYRHSLDNVSLLFGSVFWGCLASGVLLFCSFGLVTFLFVWEPSQDTMIRFAAQLLAISITLGLRSLLMMCVSSLFLGFYRSTPAWSSLMMVVLECWSLGTTVATIATRLVLMIILAAAYVGRLDTAIFAKGVDSGAFGILQDRYPILLRKDLLLHEAHRHPFIERLGTIYMLKIKHGNEFGRAPESAWRVVLTLALMPWLRKFRFDEDEHAEDGNPMESDDAPRRGAVVLPQSTELLALRQRVAELQKRNDFLLNHSEDDASIHSAFSLGSMTDNSDPLRQSLRSNPETHPSRGFLDRREPDPDSDGTGTGTMQDYSTLAAC